MVTPEQSRAYSRRYYEKHKEEIKAKQRARYAADRSYRLEYQREYGKRNAALISHAKRLRKYGLTTDEYSDLVERQMGACAICGDRTALAVDHDHATGAVRGLLCSRCNHGVGNFRDNPTLMAIAATYVGEV